MIATSEQPLCAYHMNKRIDSASLPIRSQLYTNTLCEFFSDPFVYIWVDSKLSNGLKAAQGVFLMHKRFCCSKT